MVLPDGELHQLTQPAAGADEWAESIRDSHPDTPARGDALSQHWKEVDLIQSALAPHHEQLLGLLEDREAHAAALAGAPVPWF